MATETEAAGRPKRTNNRGRTVPTRVPKLITHLVVAERFGVGAETIRRWATSEPPMFLRPQVVAGKFLFFKESEVIELIERGDWHHPVE